MKILPIYTYDQSILRKKLKPVEEMTSDLVELALSMHATMNNAEGIGLAANQVGDDRQILVIDISKTEGNEGVKPLTMINPVIEAVSEEEESYEEGCLSLPDLRADVVRPEAIQVRYLDTGMKEHSQEVDGLLARVMQHEIDHLRGIYLFDHLAPMRRALLKRKLLEIKRGELDPGYPLHPNR